MASLFSQSNFKRVEGSGAARAKKLADLYIKNHTTGNKVDDPAVYQYVNDNYLAPYMDDLGVQQKMADYLNKAELLASTKQQIAGSLAALKLKEQGAWYVDEDEAGGSTFRSPLNVARATSESLDRLVAESVLAGNEQRKLGKDASEIDNYLFDLNRKADRMRSVVTQIENGQTGELDGYGYYVDSDPNTGTIRGATFAPTDIEVDDISTNKTRTDSTIKISGADIPVYLNSIKNSSGQLVSKFGDTTYQGDTNLLSGGEKSVLLADPSKYKFDGTFLDRGKVYQSFTGETYQDGSPKKKLFYRGFDDKVYSFNDDDQQGKALIESLKSVGGVNIDHIPRINPFTATRIVANPLSSSTRNEGALAAKIIPAQQNAEVSQKESDRLNSMGSFGLIGEGIKSFFGNKNTPNKPDVAPVRTSEDMVDSGQGFFRKDNGATGAGLGFRNSN